jgi:hypothetical protein
MPTAIAFILATLLMAGCLWGGMKLTRVDGSFIAMLVVAMAANAVQLLLSQLSFRLGAVGAGVVDILTWAVVVLVTLVLIHKWTSAYFWPDAVLVVLVANLLAWFATALLDGMV